MSRIATLQSASFCDYEEYAAAIGQGDVCLRVSRMQRPQWTIRQIKLEESIHIQTASEGAGNICMGAAHDDGFGLFLSTSDHRANGEVLERGSIFLMPPGKEFCLTTGGAHEWTSVFVPFEALEVAGIMMPRFNIIETSARIVDPSNGAAKRFHSCVTRFGAGVQVEPRVLQQIGAVKSFGEALTDCLKDILLVDSAKSERKTGRPRILDHKLILKAVELIEDAPESAPTVTELVAALDVSERSLRNGFKDYFGVSPRRYMELSRLCRARSRLVAGSLPGTTVTKVAAQLGIWDFGRFAARYRALFGERPSETLRQR